MKYSVLIATLCLLAPAASAQSIERPAIRFFFSVVRPDPDLGLPAEYGLTGHFNVGIIPTALPTMTVWLYAMVEGNGVWDTIGLNYVGASGPITFQNVTMDDTPGARILRWNESGDFSGNLNGNPTSVEAISDASTTYIGLRHPYPAALDALDPHGRQVVSGSNGRTLYYLAEAQLTGPGAVYLHVGQPGITRFGGNPETDSVYFGFNDPLVRGNQIGAASQFPDLIVDIPEPATGTLLLAGVFFLRRR